MYAMITTDKRGVFFGKVKANVSTQDKEITIEECQMAVRFVGTFGVLGLCVDGPTKECRITKPVKSFTVEGITGIGEVSDKAKKAWKKCPWA